MTREEAIKELQESLDTLREYDIAHSSRLKQALEMAIQALSQKPTDENLHREREQAYMQGYEDASKRFRQEPCDDAISREELLKAIDTWDKFGFTETGCFVREPKGDYVPYIHYDDVIKCIKGMPSVTRKSGKWIYSDLLRVKHGTMNIDALIDKVWAKMESEEQTE